MVELNLTPGDCKNAAEMLELYFFQNIRDYEDMDNLEYVRSLLNCIDELTRVSKLGGNNV